MPPLTVGQAVTWMRRPIGLPVEFLLAIVVEVNCLIVIQFETFDGYYYRRVRRSDLLIEREY